MFRIFAIAMLSGLVVAPAAHAGKKAKKNKKKGEPPPVGWHAEDAETWKGMCWYPPDFEAMGAGERRMASLAFWAGGQFDLQHDPPPRMPAPGARPCICATWGGGPPPNHPLPPTPTHSTVSTCF